MVFFSCVPSEMYIYPLRLHRLIVHKNELAICKYVFGAFWKIYTLPGGCCQGMSTLFISGKFFRMRTREKASLARLEGVNALTKAAFNTLQHASY